MNKPISSIDFLRDLNNTLKLCGCGNMSANTLIFYLEIYAKFDYYIKSGCQIMQAYENVSIDVNICFNVVRKAVKIVNQINHAINK
jgi:hypothetical protein